MSLESGGGFREDKSIGVFRTAVMRRGRRSADVRTCYPSQTPEPKQGATCCWMWLRHSSVLHSSVLHGRFKARQCFNFNTLLVQFLNNRNDPGYNYCWLNPNVQQTEARVHHSVRKAESLSVSVFSVWGVLTNDALHRLVRPKSRKHRDPVTSRDSENSEQSRLILLRTQSSSQCVSVWVCVCQRGCFLL